MSVKKIIAIILGVILLIAVLVVAASAIASSIYSNKNMELAESFDKVEKEDQLTPEKDENGNWYFVTDREFKIMRLTDIHIGGGWLSAKKDAQALNCIAAMIAEEKPDLVIATGDIAFPFPDKAGTLNNLAAAKIFAKLMDKLGVYWTVAFGNHDTEAYSFYSREKLGEYYMSDELRYCLYTPGLEEVDGYGNQIINVKNSKGLITQSLIMFDSHSYPGIVDIGGKYDNIHQNQIDWYRKNIQELNSYNAEILKTLSSDSLAYPEDTYKNVKSLAFFHIPLREYDTAWSEYENAGFKNTENVKYIYGEKNENVCCGAEDDEVFETMLQLGSTQGVFVGHDHVNNYSIDYKGIRLTYGLSVDYLAYKDIDKKGDYRGCTMITAYPDGKFDCRAESYYQDKYTPKYEKESVTFEK